MKRFLVALMGGTVLLIGLTLIVLPGPAFIVIPAGLAILATEFLWARRALDRCKKFVARIRSRRGADQTGAEQRPNPRVRTTSSRRRSPWRTGRAIR